MNNSKRRLYIAYGSNLNLEQMSRRCPTAKVAGTSMLTGWRLMFRGGKTNAVATIEPFDDSCVPVLVWELQPRDEKALDVYEGYPILYRKNTLRVTLDGEEVDAMVYIMNGSGRYGQPNLFYFNAIYAGYMDAGFDINILYRALLDTGRAVVH